MHSNPNFQSATLGQQPLGVTSKSAFAKGRAKLKSLDNNRNRLILVGVCAAILGLLAAYSAKGYLTEQVAREKARLNPRVETVDLVVAKTNLPKGTVISMENMAVRPVPAEFAVGQAIRPDQIEGFIGAKLAVPVRAGEALITSATEGADLVTFAAKLKPGVRAMTVSVDEVTSVSGMLQPGDRIDLLWSVKPQQLRPSDQRSTADSVEQTVVFMQDVRVLATGRQVRPGADETRPRGYTTVTLEATAEQAKKLVAAQRTGRLTALLRNPEDNTPMDQRPADLTQLLNLSSAQQATQVQRWEPEVIVGGQGDISKQRKTKGD